MLEDLEPAVASSYTNVSVNSITGERWLLTCVIDGRGDFLHVDRTRALVSAFKTLP